MLGVVFVLLFAFSYSEDVVFAVLEAAGRDHVVGWLIGLIGFDAAILATVGLLETFHRPGIRRGAATVAMLVDLLRRRSIHRRVPGSAARRPSAMD